MAKRPSSQKRNDKYEELKRVADSHLAKIQATGDTRLLRIYDHACKKLFEEGNPHFFLAFQNLKRVPVTIDEFIESKEFLGSHLTVWDEVKKDLQQINPDIFAGETPVHQALLGGATATGKTVTSHVTTAYHAYLLSCFKNPHKLFNLAPSTKIVFVFQSVSKSITETVLYKPFRQMIDDTPYFQKWTRYDKKIQSQIRFDNNVQINQALAHAESLVGQAIIGGIVDEVNFMSVVEASKKVYGARGSGGTYDQAELLYRTLTRRRKSRFITQGISLGCLCIISSVRYVDDFLSRRIREVKNNREPSIFYATHKQYEVQPNDRYSGQKFRLLIGNDHYSTRVIEDGEVEGKDFPEGAEIELVPIEYLYEFRSDPDNALRDVIGKATSSIRPFFTQRHKLIEAEQRWRRMGCLLWTHKDNFVLARDGMPQIVAECLPKDLKTPRFIGIDLSKSKDRCGISVVKPLPNTFVESMGAEGKVIESLPRFLVELAISIQPDAHNHIDVPDIRKWVLQLARFWNIPIQLIAYDGFSSNESIQILRKAGLNARLVSVDADPEPYLQFKRMVNEDRIALPPNELLMRELCNVEWLEEKQKVEHPPSGSKDVADAVCRALFGALNSRFVRNRSHPVTSDSGMQYTGYNQRRRNSNRKRIIHRPTLKVKTKLGDSHGSEEENQNEHQRLAKRNWGNEGFGD